MVDYKLFEAGSYPLTHARLQHRFAVRDVCSGCLGVFPPPSPLALIRYCDHCGLRAHEACTETIYVRVETAYHSNIPTRQVVCRACCFFD